MGLDQLSISTFLVMYVHPDQIITMDLYLLGQQLQNYQFSQLFSKSLDRNVLLDVVYTASLSGFRFSKLCNFCKKDLKMGSLRLVVWSTCLSCKFRVSLGVGIAGGRKSEVVDLGVLFDSKLMYSANINKIMKECLRMLVFFIDNISLLFFIQNPLRVTVRTLYLAYIRSKLAYCSPKRSPTYQKYIHKRVQNKLFLLSTL